MRSRITALLPTRCSDACGFTLMELLLTISLMSLVVGMALPRFSAIQDSFFATESARDLAARIRAARVAAINHRTTVALTVSSSEPDILQERRLPSQIWEVEQSTGILRSRSDGHSVWDAPVIHRHRAPGMLGFDPPDPAILFFANGSSTGGRILVNDSEGNPSLEFLVDAATGELFTQQVSEERR